MKYIFTRINEYIESAFETAIPQGFSSINRNMSGVQRRAIIPGWSGWRERKQKLANIVQVPETTASLNDGVTGYSKQNSRDQGSAGYVGLRFGTTIRS